jgi:predicted nucleotidyltransferase component of viral defense system
VADLLQRVQARFLKELFQSSKGGFVLKGGMALSALFGASRLTRDVDLDFPPREARTADSLHNQVNRALEQALRGTGVTDVRINKPGKAEISPQWKVSGRTTSTFTTSAHWGP